MKKSLIKKSDVSKSSILCHEDIGRWAVWNNGDVIFVSNSPTKCDKIIKDLS